MHDQADELRQLVQQVALSQPAPTGQPPKLIAVAGGKTEVGTTTVAVNLAVALVAQGSRVVLVDADADGPDVAELCHMPVATNHVATRFSPDDFAHENRLANLPAVSKPLRESLRPGPLGVELLVSANTGGANTGGANTGGAITSGPMTSGTAAGPNRLIDQLKQLGDRTDIVILDVGNTLDRASHRIWQIADEVILVTTPEDAAIMDAYATIKNFLGSASTTKLRVVVNRVTDIEAARDAGRRLSQACQRFLGRDLRIGDLIASDDEVTRAARERCPLAARPSQGPAAQAIEELAVDLRTELGIDRPAKRQSPLGIV